MSEDSQNTEFSFVIKALLQDSLFLQRWDYISDVLLGITAADLIPMQSRYRCGNAHMYQIIKEMLVIWRGKLGNMATPQRFKEILIKGDFKNAADLIQNALKSPNQPLTSDLTTMQPQNLIIIERLDYGTFSEVLKAKGTLDLVDYAVKRISFGNFILLTTHTQLANTSGTNRLDNFDKLVREVKAMAKLQKSNHIVTYHEAWFEGPLTNIFQPMLSIPQQSSRPTLSPSTSILPHPSEDEINTFFCIKMELCDTNLEKWMDTNPRPRRDFKTSLCIVKQILDGLTHIHSKNFIHRDLKPTNIFIDISQVSNDLVAKIGDFGLARQLPDPEVTLSRIQVPIRNFQSPEMIRGEPYNQQTDIYSVGLIFLNLVYPFATIEEQETIFANVRSGYIDEYIPVLIQLYGNLEYFQLLKKMLSLRSENRPDAQNALEKLNQLMGLTISPDLMETE